jgi:uncharacterized protein (TIRG00374 family)
MVKRGNHKVQLWLTSLGLGLLILLLYSKRQALGDTVNTIKDANLALVLLLPVLQVINFYVVAKYYQAMLRFFKVSMSAIHLWGVVAALTFVGQILPSGGMSGLAYLAYGFRNKVSAGVVGLIQLGRYVLSLSSYFIISPLILLMVLYSGETDWINNTFDKFKSSPEAIGLIIGFVLIAIFTFIIFSNRRHSLEIASKIEILLNKFVSLFRRKRRANFVKKGVIRRAMHDFHDGFTFLRSKGLKALRPIIFMFANTFMELAIVFTAFQAVGGEISIGILIISFIAAQIAGVVSIIPGDVGVHEGVMIIMLSSLGVDDAIAISATLLYRLFNKIIFLPLGFYFYTKLLNPSKV